MKRLNCTKLFFFFLTETFVPRSKQNVIQTSHKFFSFEHFSIEKKYIPNVLLFSYNLHIHFQCSISKKCFNGKILITNPLNTHFFFDLQ